MAPGCFLKVGCPDNPVENRHSAEMHPLHKLRYRRIGLDIVYINMGIEIEIDLDTEPEYRKRKINPTLPPTANSLHAVCSCP